MRYRLLVLLLLGAACGTTATGVRATKDLALSAPHVGGQKFSVETRSIL